MVEKFKVNRLDLATCCAVGITIVAVAAFGIPWATSRSIPIVVDAVAPSASSSLPITPILPEAGVEEAACADCWYIIAGYETPFVWDNARGRNIQLLAIMLHEVIIEPITTWSFNAEVGPRTKERGFEDAPTIFMGVMTPDVGGGSCQVSSTIHAAARWAELKVLLRAPHSRILPYIDPGLDATVATCPADAGSCVPADLMLSNPYSHRIRIWVSVTRNPYENDPHTDVWYPTMTSLKAAKKNERMLDVQIAIQGVDLRSNHWPTGVVPTNTFTGYDGDQPEKKFHKSSAIRTGSYKKLLQSSHVGTNVLTCLQFNYEVPKKECWKSHYKPVDEVWEVGFDRLEDAGPPWGK